MSEGVDIWQRYDAKVVQVRELEERLKKLEERLVALAEERDQRANACAVLTQKLTSARLIAERLRNAERAKDGGGGGGGDLSNHRLRAEYDRAREVIGCLLTSLSGSWSAREQVWRADSTSGGRLLYALTRGAMASVSMDSFRVDHDWLRRLDLDRLRIELGFDDGGVDLSVEEEFDEVEEEYEVDGIEPAATVSVEDIYDQDDLPPPPSFTGSPREEPPPPLISALEAFEGIEPDPEKTRVMRAPTEPLPTRQGESKRETTAVRSIPAPFTIGKLVKPTS
ncbi:MAG: hypothetical protein KC486_25325 [Myxococcales bacterium]|nr:hypothetical protein [Myxococcales bacterium]